LGVIRKTSFSKDTLNVGEDNMFWRI
jgi:hypothetical protein